MEGSGEGSREGGPGSLAGRGLPPHQGVTAGQPLSCRATAGAGGDAEEGAGHSGPTPAQVPGDFAPSPSSLG